MARKPQSGVVPMDAPQDDNAGVAAALNSASIERDARTGQPRKIRGDFDLRSGDAAFAADAGAEPVHAFLTAHAATLGLPADAQSLKKIQDVTTPTRRSVRFQQMHEGVPVLDSTVLVQLDAAERIRQIDLGHAQPVVADAAASASAKALSAADALKAAMSAAGNPTLRQPSKTPEKAYFPTDSGLKLVYVALILTRDPAHDWRIVVDAATGAILEQRDLIQEIDGQGMVFDPNPVVTANNNALRDPDAVAGTCGFAGTARATIDLQRVARPLRGITLLAGTHRLEGPFARVHEFGAPAPAFPMEAGANNFNYSSGDDRFEAVNAYYHIDTIQRYIQSLGITTANNRVTDYDPHYGSGAAFYSPGDLGLHFSDSGPCRPDRAEDGHCITHEYGHAIQDNQVPGWGQTNPVTGRDETGAMGEGFGDILACTFFAEAGGGFEREVFEQWVFGDAGGLRRVDGSKVYPADWSSEVHNDGEIWSAALWNIYRAIGGDSAVPAERLAARDALLKSLILSHHRLLPSASMPDGAEALMDENAELDDYLGKHLMPMLDSFHDRGLLPSHPGVDLYIRDDASDPGADAFVGPVFWDSPDVWVRNANDNGTTHQDPEFGQDNWLYARVTNRGTQPARAFVVTFNVKTWAGVQFVYPGDFVPSISAAVGYNLAPGASTIVKAKWPAALVPSAGTHGCLLVSAYTPVDTTPAGSHVWEKNNLAQKNLTIVDLIPGDSALVRFQLGNRLITEKMKIKLQIRRPKSWAKIPVSLVPTHFKAVERMLDGNADEMPRPMGMPQPKSVVRFLDTSEVEIMQTGGTAPVRITLAPDSTLRLGGPEEQAPPDAPGKDEIQADVATSAAGRKSLNFRSGVLASIPLQLAARQTQQMALKVTAPPDAKPGEVIKLHLVQRDAKNAVIGGITVQINVVAKK